MRQDIKEIVTLPTNDLLAGVIRASPWNFAAWYAEKQIRRALAARLAGDLQQIHDQRSTAMEEHGRNREPTEPLTPEGKIAALRARVNQRPFSPQRPQITLLSDAPVPRPQVKTFWLRVDTTASGTVEELVGALCEAPSLMAVTEYAPDSIQIKR